MRPSLNTQYSGKTPPQPSPKGEGASSPSFRRGLGGGLHSPLSTFHSRRGQTLVLAVVIMFLLSFLGVIFIAMVTRNLFRAGRSSQTLKAEQLARAGIEFADAMLTQSEDGADWRPVPPLDTELVPNDPDSDWINNKPLPERFSRINSGSGRFLLRVSYNPVNGDPISKFIKIESIGRIGAIDPTDPTTMATASKHLLRFEMTAYKPIGVTDYCRFITNKEKRGTAIALGFPGAGMTLGRQPVDQNDPGKGAPIRVNGNLTWCGKNVDVILRATTVRPITGGVGPHPIDSVAVSGEISLAAIAPDDPANRTLVTLRRLYDNVTSPGFSSSDPGFTSFVGMYRDGLDVQDVGGYPRAVRRVEAPILDVFDRSSKAMRYRALTRNSGEWLNPQYNTGFNGWGRGIYIDNWSDVQKESETLFGGYTLRADWMEPNNDMSPYWRGSFYVPPGVRITLNPVSTDDDNGDGLVDDKDIPDITLTRTDIGSNNEKRVWLDPNGNPVFGWGQTITMEYPENGVIYAEGNIRIKGMLPPNAQLTVVSGGTIYIEGNILKYRARGQVRPDPKEKGAVALLAKDYVCVNTTQFVSLLSETGPSSIGSDSETGEPPFHLIISPEPSSNFRCGFAFGPADYLLEDFHPFICARHSGQYGSSYINMWVNRGDPTGGTGLYSFGPPPPPLQYIYGLADPNFGGLPGVGISTVFEHKAWELGIAPIGDVAPPGVLDRSAGIANYLEVGLDQSTITRNNYLLSGFTIQPMDVVIEAIIYAQNRSFFIIPGPWFNPDPDDTPDKYQARGKRPLGTAPLFPFFGQPLDIKITIDGAITENLPASIGDVSEWASKWCNIPAMYGSADASTNSRPTRHPGEGITFLYDDIAGWPRVDYTGAPQADFVRIDDYGRALPAAPKLPVSPTLIFYGEAI